MRSRGWDLVNFEVSGIPWSSCFPPILGTNLLTETLIVIFTAIDTLLAFDPLDMDHVKRCNTAEAEFWRRNEGYQTLPSDKLLQFDCGGQVRIVLRSNYFVLILIYLLTRKTFIFDPYGSNGYLKYASPPEVKMKTMAVIWHL
jgi:hypothetical protein